MNREGADYKRIWALFWGDDSFRVPLVPARPRPHRYCRAPATPWVQGLAGLPRRERLMQVARRTQDQVLEECVVLLDLGLNSDEGPELEAYRLAGWSLDPLTTCFGQGASASKPFSGCATSSAVYIAAVPQ
jgi:hypothetical protein